ncbi:kinase-like domain-containing protein [Nemania diffusa]|nr:kinase-like domain-containing protein [Nemania diffusa]
MRLIHNDAGLIPLKTMRGKLNAAMQSSGKFLEEFLPETELLDLVHKDTIAAILQAIPESLKRNQQTKDDVLADYFAQHALKVFAILVRTDLLHHIEYLHKKCVQDKMLPIKLTWRNYSRDAWDVGSYDKNTDDEEIRQAFGCIGDVDNPWEDHTIERFFDGQWPLVPARFYKHQFRYNFPLQIRLPFTWTSKNVNPGSFFSWVEEKCVHAHYFPKDLDIVVPVDDKNNFRVAIKKFQKSGTFERVAQREVTMLELARILRHDHLIQAIAYYNIGQDHYLMFPWAGMGNLWDFWEKNGKVGPTAGKEEVVWMVNQIAGLADAVEQLHNLNCRHGDLKPSNILCFETESDDLKPRLVIADVGVARIHSDYTRERDTTRGIQATARYEAPELLIYSYRPISRRFDIWSLGCIFLEFVDWLLYGPEELLRLRERTERFFKIEDTNGKMTAHVSQEVDKLFAYINEDWRCAKGVAIRQLVELIQYNMLVVELDKRISAGEMGTSLKDIVNGLMRDNEPLEGIVSKPLNNAPAPLGPFSVAGT